MAFDFDTVAEKYDNWYQFPFGRMADQFEKDVIISFLKKIPTNVVFEIGSGTGHWTSFFSEQGFFVLGMDNSEKMLEIARKKNIKNASFIKGDAHHLPFHNNSIENIVSIATIEFTENPAKVLEEIHRVLKPGGALLLGCLNENGSLFRERNEKPPYNKAQLFNLKSLYDTLSDIGNPELAGGALFPYADKELDKADSFEKNASNEEKLERGNFLVGFVIKKDPSLSC